MLVLSRKVGEQLDIGNDIVIAVSRIAGNRVTLAVDAPKHVSIVRHELPPRDRPSVNAGRVAFQQAAEAQVIRLTEQKLLEAVSEVAAKHPEAAAAIAAFGREVAKHSEDRTNFEPLNKTIDTLSGGKRSA